MSDIYVSLNEIKGWLGITTDTQDTVLDIIRNAASRAVDDWCGAPARRFYLDTTTTVRYYTADDARHIFIDDIDSTTPTITVETDDNNNGTFEQAWTRDNVASYGYRLEPLNAAAHGHPYTAIRAISHVFPRTNQGVKITAKHGYSAAVPPEVKLATLLTAEASWRSSGALQHTGGVPEVQAVKLEGSDSVTLAKSKESTGARAGVPEAAQDLLNTYVRLV